MNRRFALIVQLAAAAAIGIAYPYVELAWKCRDDYASEVCTWGRAYFPLSRWVEPIIVAPLAFAVIALVGVVVRRRRAGEEPSR
jgi:hypothetical protein